MTEVIAEGLLHGIQGKDSKIPDTGWVNTGTPAARQ
jgi:hypothetical protein